MNTEQIRQKVRLEIERQKALQKEKYSYDITSLVHNLKYDLFPKPKVPENSPLTPNDFLSYFDEDFVCVAYLSILKRNPREGELRYYLTRLRKGKIDRIEVLGRLRYSTEGKEKAVPFHNLSLKYYLRKILHIPLIGIVLKIIIQLISLPKTLALIHTHEAQNLWRFRMLEKNQFRNMDAIYWSLQNDIDIKKQE